MSDIATAEVLAESVPPPAPEASEVDAAPDTALAEVLDQAAPEGEAPAAAPELTYPNGSTSELVVDHFIHTEGVDQSMNQIKAALPHIAGNTIESAVRRLAERGRLLRVAPGTYRLGPETPPEPTKPAAPPEPAPVRAVDEMTDQAWLEACEGWLADSSSWAEELGPGPDQVENNIPHQVKLRFNDRLRKREERRRDREAALARQAEADAALRAKLIAGCFNNVTLGAGINDLAVIKSMLQVVPLEHILLGLKRVVDRRIEPRAAPIARWTDERFLVSVARTFLLNAMLPQMVATWAAAGTAPAKVTERAEASPAVQVPATSENAPAPSRPQPDAPSNGDAIGSQAAALLRDFGLASPDVTAAAPADPGHVQGRAEVMAAFGRARVPQEVFPKNEKNLDALKSKTKTPQPATPSPRPAPPQPRQAEPEITEAAYDEYVAGWVAGNLEWPRRMLGPAPGESGCRVPLSVLKRNRLA